MKTWRVTCEINMDASREATVEVRANTERKAKLFAEEKFKKLGYLYVTNFRVTQVA